MSDLKTVEVTVALSPRDLHRANFSIALERMKWKRSLITSMLFGALVFAGLFLAYREQLSFLWGAAAGIVFGILLWTVLTPCMMLLSYVILYFSSRSLIRNNPHALGPVTYRFTESGYSYTGPNGNGDVRWTAFPKIYETREDFLLYFVKHLAYVIPKRCFLGEQTIKVFKGMLEKGYKGELRLRG